MMLRKAPKNLEIFIYRHLDALKTWALNKNTVLMTINLFTVVSVTFIILNERFPSFSSVNCACV